MFHHFDRRVFLASLLLWSSAAHAEYCLNYSSGVMSLGRQAGSSSSRGCVATESQCKAALMSNASSYSGSCYYVPGLYPRTGSEAKGQNNKAIQTDNPAAKATEDRKNKQAEEQARQQLKFNNEKDSLQHDLKGDLHSEPENRITLKPIPPAGELARSQLDCISHKQPGESWEKQAADCTPVTPRVPEPSNPVKVEVPPHQ